jgi:hypothetical protein
VAASNSLDEKQGHTKPTPRPPQSPIIPPHANIFRGALSSIAPDMLRLFVFVPIGVATYAGLMFVFLHSLIQELTKAIRY